MTWWIAFIIAVLGWFFAAKENAKSNARTLLNQEIKDAREKLHGIIVSCSDSDKTFPLLYKDEVAIKMQNYIVTIQEVDRLYDSYHFPFFKRIKFLNWLFSKWIFFSDCSFLVSAKSSLKEWVVPEPCGTNKNQYSGFNVNSHAKEIRRALTDDDENVTDDLRLYKIQLEYKRLCLHYKLVS